METQLGKKNNKHTDASLNLKNYVVQNVAKELKLDVEFVSAQYEKILDIVSNIIFLSTNIKYNYFFNKQVIRLNSYFSFTINTSYLLRLRKKVEKLLNKKVDSRKLTKQEYGQLNKKIRFIKHHINNKKLKK